MSQTSDEEVMSEITAANVTNLTTHFRLDRRTVLPPVGTVSLHVIRTYPEEGDTCIIITMRPVQKRFLATEVS